jgi:hypothetical protein
MRSDELSILSFALLRSLSLILMRSQFFDSVNAHVSDFRFGDPILYDPAGDYEFRPNVHVRERVAGRVEGRSFGKYDSVEQVEECVELRTFLYPTRPS